MTDQEIERVARKPSSGGLVRSMTNQDALERKGYQHWLCPLCYWFHRIAKGEG